MQLQCMHVIINILTGRNFAKLYYIINEIIQQAKSLNFGRNENVSCAQHRALLNRHIIPARSNSILSLHSKCINSSYVYAKAESNTRLQDLMHNGEY